MLGFDTLADTLVHGTLRRLRIVGVSFVLTAVVLVASAGTAFAWGAAAFSPGDEQLLLSLTNQDRASGGLNALVSDGYLHKEAEWRAQDMGERNYFSHAIPPSGSSEGCSPLCLEQPASLAFARGSQAQRGSSAVAIKFLSFLFS